VGGENEHNIVWLLREHPDAAATGHSRWVHSLLRSASVPGVVNHVALPDARGLPSWWPADRSGWVVHAPHIRDVRGIRLAPPRVVARNVAWRGYHAAPLAVQRQLAAARRAARRRRAVDHVLGRSWSSAERAWIEGVMTREQPDIVVFDSVFTLDGVDTSATGGCGASVTGTFEINVVGATRIWLAYSDNPTDPTSWHTSLALDDNPTGQLVSYQLAPGAVDSAGNVYVAYDESLQPYPDYDGAPVKYIWAGPDLAGWSAPVTVAPGGGPGHVLPHIVAGDPGNLDIAYWTGQQDGSNIRRCSSICRMRTWKRRSRRCARSVTRFATRSKPAPTV